MRVSLVSRTSVGAGIEWCQPIDDRQDRRPAGREQDERRRPAPTGSGATLVGCATPVVGIAGRGSPAVCAMLTTEVRRAVPSEAHGAHEARRMPPPAAESRPNRPSGAAHEPRRRRLPAAHEPWRGGGAPSPVAGRGSSALQGPSRPCSQGAEQAPCSVSLSERRSIEPSPSGSKTSHSESMASSSSRPSTPTS